MRGLFAGAVFVLLGACDAGDGREDPSEPGTGTGGPPGAEVFAADQILEVRLTMAAEDWERLEEHGNEEVYLPGAATVRGTSLTEVRFAKIGVRHKGAYSLHHCWDNFGGVRGNAPECAKLSYKLKLDEYDTARRLDGLKRLNLHAAAGDATKLRELIAYATFNEFGVDAPRATPARLYINGEYQGVFIAVEELDGRYTKAHFPEGPDGNLYKEVWPRTEVADSRFVAALETNEESPDVSGMRAFATTIAASTPETFEDDMAGWIDLDNTLRYLAVDRALKNWDGIMAFYSPVSPHNFYWYEDPNAASRFRLIPWDLDNTFWEFDPYMQPEGWVTAAPMPDWNSAPLNCSARPVWTPDNAVKLTPPRCDPFLDLLAQTHWERFAAIGAELLAGPFTEARLNEKVRYWESRIAPLVQDDPVVGFSTWQSDVSRFPQIVARAVGDFQTFIDTGLIEEAPPPEPEPELPPELLDEPSADAGLHPDGVTNFEFEAPLESLPVGVGFVADPSARAAATWNTVAPLSGGADLRFDFTFNRAPGTYNEWAIVGIVADGTFDLTERASIVVTMSSDRSRTVRVRVVSPAYEDVFGGAWSEFGREVSVGPTPKAVTIALDSLYYPDWARSEWQSGMGWIGSDEAALRTVLQRAAGLSFAPSATFDGGGELAAASETGHLQIDNIHFR